MKILLILLALLPGLAICYYIYRADKYEKEDQLPLFLSFFMGVAITWPAIKLEEWISQFGLENTANIGIALAASFIGVALIEEVLKFLCLWAYPYQRPFFNEPFDGIVYTVMIGMGFATLENILYALRYGFGTTLLRVFTAVPAHAVFAVLMGYYIGKAKFDAKNKWRLLFTGLGIAIGVHGIYDFFILQEAIEWLIIFAIVTLVISVRFAQKLIKIQQDQSPFRPENSGFPEEE